MHVTVQITSRYSTRNIRVNVDAFDTIASLRSMLEVQEGLKTHAQGHLTLDGRVLLDNVLLTTLNLDTDSTSKRVLHLAGYQFQVVLKSITGRKTPITVSSNLPVSDIYDIMLEQGLTTGPYRHEAFRLIAPRIRILPLYRSAEDILLRPGTLIYCTLTMKDEYKPLYVSLWDWDGKVERRWHKGRPLIRGEIIRDGRGLPQSLGVRAGPWLQTSDGVFPAAYVKKVSKEEIRHGLTLSEDRPETPPPVPSLTEDLGEEYFHVSLGNEGCDFLELQVTFRPSGDYYLTGHFMANLSFNARALRRVHLISVLAEIEFEEFAILEVDGANTFTWKLSSKDLVVAPKNPEKQNFPQEWKPDELVGEPRCVTIQGEPNQVRVKIQVDFDLGGGSRLAELEEWRILRL